MDSLEIIIGSLFGNLVAWTILAQHFLQRAEKMDRYFSEVVIYKRRADSAERDLDAVSAERDRYAQMVNKNAELCNDWRDNASYWFNHYCQMSKTSQRKGRTIENLQRVLKRHKTRFCKSHRLIKEWHEVARANIARSSGQIITLPPAPSEYRAIQELIHENQEAGCDITYEGRDQASSFRIYRPAKVSQAEMEQILKTRPCEVPMLPGPSRKIDLLEFTPDGSIEEIEQFVEKAKDALTGPFIYDKSNLNVQALTVPCIGFNAVVLEGDDLNNMQPVTYQASDQDFKDLFSRRGTEGGGHV